MMTEVEPSPRTLISALRQNVMRLRAERGWSQQKLADFAGISVKTICKLECGRKRETIQMRTVSAIGEALAVEPIDLFR